MSAVPRPVLRLEDVEGLSVVGTQQQEGDKPLAGDAGQR